jgi:hypothetical protein
MKHIRRFNEEIRHDYQQEDDRVFADDLDRLVGFVRKNEDMVFDLIEFWETSHGREFIDSDFDKWFDENMLYENEVDEKVKFNKRSK